MDSLVFTPASVLDLLSKIDELKDVNVGISQTLDGKIQIQVGDSVYLIDGEDAKEVSVDESTVNSIDDANEEAYEDLESSGEIDVDISDEYSEDEYVESGLLKEMVKSLALGGMIRLSAKLLK